MDTLKGLASGGNAKKESDKPESGIIASAKSVAEAAKSTFTSEPDKVDKPKVGGTTDGVLETAKGYLKTGQEGVGKIVNQAGEYIHKNTPAAEADKPEKKEEGGSGFAGDALKKAGDFFKK